MHFSNYISLSSIVVLAACGGTPEQQIDVSVPTTMELIENSDASNPIVGRAFVTEVNQSTNTSRLLSDPQTVKVHFTQEGEATILYANIFGQDLVLTPDDMISDYEYKVSLNGTSYWVFVHQDVLEKYVNGESSLRYSVPFGASRWEENGDGFNYNGSRVFGVLGSTTHIDDLPNQSAEYSGVYRGTANKREAADFGAGFYMDASIEVDFKQNFATGSFSDFHVWNHDTNEWVLNESQPLLFNETDITGTSFETTVYAETGNCNPCETVTNSHVNLQFYGNGAAELGGNAMIEIEGAEGKAVILNGVVSTNMD